MAYCTGILGSAFNPPTCGHKDVIEQAASICNHIILVPSFQHAFAKKMLNFENRLILTRLFISEFAVPGCKIEVSDIEQSIATNAHSTPVYTYDVMDAMQYFLPNNQLLFIRGPDNADLAVWSKFYRYRDIEERWEIFTAEERVPIRSSYVRKILSSSWKVKKKRVLLTDFLTPKVSEYIFSRGLLMSEHDMG